MLCHAQSCVFVVVLVLLLSCCRVTNSIKPTISPNQTELVINEENTLEIMCTGNDPIKFTYPLTTKTINTSSVRTTEYEKDNVRTFILQRTTVFGDTGWYGCADKDVSIDSDNHDDPEVNWLYVYVKSDRNFFVEYTSLNLIEICANEDIVLPCRPTSPDLVVNFEAENIDVLKNKTSFDPKVGFLIRNVQTTDSGEISCIIEKDNYKQMKNYTLYVEEDQDLPNPLIEPLIDGESVHLFTRGEDVRLNCTVKINNATRYNFSWIRYPKMDHSRSSMQLFTEMVGPNKVLITSQMTIFNTTDEDKGFYTCLIRTTCGFKSTPKYLELRVKPVTALRFAPYYFLDEVADFTCDVMALPRPNISLTYNKYPNYPLLTNSTEIQETSQTESSPILSYTHIKITIETLGVLTCESCNDLGCNKSTEVISVSGGVGPLNIIMSKQPITRDDNVELICGAFIYKYTSKLTWKNEKDEPIEETSASERIKIIRDETPLTYLSILTIHQAQRSDAQNYTCYGQVKSVDDFKLPMSMSYKLVVEEPVPPYFIMTNMNETIPRNIDVTQNKSKTEVLKCIADGLPKPEITWYKDGELIEENARYKFTNNNQELNINFISQIESGIYLCRASNRVGTKEASQKIIVHEEWDEGYIILTTSIVILFIVLLILAAFFIRKLRREKKIREELIELGLTNFEKGALESLNPELTVDDQAELLPYDKKWEFPKERLKLGKQLGSGMFGVVMKAQAQRICLGQLVTTVAVKMPRQSTDPTYVRALASELKIMVHLGKHLNIVNLLGACTKNISKRELLVILEYCPFGNLHNYLLRHGKDFINQIDPNTKKIDNTIGLDILTKAVNANSSNSTNSSVDTVQYCPTTNSDSQEICLSPNGGILSNNTSQPGKKSNYYDDYRNYHLKPIRTQDLLSYAFQVARGMEYLSQRKVLHGDLAARNILLTEENVVKICDFGLAKDMYKEGNYKKKGDTRLPIKWMAIESIKNRIFSTQSDIWSYGIVLWEFFTLAETPYHGMEVEKMYRKLTEGYRLEQPEYAMPEIYDIMLQCWQAKPALRPRFTHLVTSIGDLLEESVKSHYISLNTPYMEINKMILENSKNDYLAMMSAPDHEVLSSLSVNSPAANNGADPPYLHTKSSSQTEETGKFSPKQQDYSHSESLSSTTTSEEIADDLSMLKQEFDPYLKPINVQERRLEFARQRQAMKNRMTDHSIDPTDRPVDREPGYCNTPRNLHLIDQNGVDKSDAVKDSE